MSPSQKVLTRHHIFSGPGQVTRLLLWHPLSFFLMASGTQAGFPFLPKILLLTCCSVSLGFFCPNTKCRVTVVFSTAHVLIALQISSPALILSWVFNNKNESNIWLKKFLKQTEQNSPRLKNYQDYKNSHCPRSVVCDNLAYLELRSLEIQLRQGRALCFSRWHSSPKPCLICGHLDLSC